MIPAVLDILLLKTLLRNMPFYNGFPKTEDVRLWHLADSLKRRRECPLSGAKQTFHISVR